MSKPVRIIEAAAPGMIRTVRITPTAAPEVISTVEQTATIAGYLRQLGFACLEAASNARVRPLLVALLLRAPGTLATLGRKRKRIAA